MLESIKKSPVKIGIILVILILVNVGGWYIYLNWDTPLDEALDLPTLTPEPQPSSTLTATPEPEIIDTEVPTPTATLEIVDTPTPTIEPVCGSDTSLTILLIGIDTENYLYGLADSISLVRLDFQTQKVAMISFPRDLWVDIPGASSHGVTEGKLNQAYFYGTEGMGFFDGSGYGAGLLADTLLNNFGISVDHYLTINKYAFRNIVDALGGISVYLPEPVYYKSISVPTPKLLLPAGYHNINGSLAEKVVRSRQYADGDFGRVRMQNQVIKGLANQILTPTGITQIPALANQLRGYVVTDFSTGDITQMACLAAHIDPGEDLVFSNIIPTELIDAAGRFVWDNYREESVFALVVDKEFIIQRLADFQAGIWPAQ
jgi:LCP family protein required for cell wall assembly